MKRFFYYFILSILLVVIYILFDKNRCLKKLALKTNDKLKECDSKIDNLKKKEKEINEKVDSMSNADVDIMFNQLFRN